MGHSYKSSSRERSGHDYWVIIGSVTGNVALWIAIGPSLGAGIGIAVGTAIISNEAEDRGNNEL